MSIGYSASTDFEKQVNSLDRATLLPIVRQKLDDKEVDLLTWAFRPLSEFSAVGYLFSVTGTARSGSDMLDWSLFLKIVPSPTSDSVKIPVLSDNPSHFGYWKREMFFYQSGLSDELPNGLVAPHCYQVWENPDSYWLWIENIIDTTEWSLATYGLAARQFGHLNGLYAMERPLPSWRWLATDKGLAQMIVDQRLVTDESWHQLSELSKQHSIVRQAWPDDVIDGMQRLWEERQEYFSVLNMLPKTLSHGDVARKNLFARQQTQGRDQIVAIDWGLLGIAPLGQEISGLTIHTIVGQFLPPGDLEELDGCVFDAYVQGLRDVGWKGDPRTVRLAYTARTALHFSLLHRVRRHERIFLDKEAGKQIETDTGLSEEEYLHMLATVRRYIVTLADKTRALKAALIL